MAELRVGVSVEGTDISGALDADVTVILKNPDACIRCRENEDPESIPLHRSCHCRVETVNISQAF